LGRSDFERILDLLAIPPSDLVRKDKRFTELGLHEGDCHTRDQVIDVLLEHPELMQRPVIVHGDRAVIARPAERVLELLD
jgi:arsenate reductase